MPQKSSRVASRRYAVEPVLTLARMVKPTLEGPRECELELVILGVILKVIVGAARTGLSDRAVSRSTAIPGLDTTAHGHYHRARLPVRLWPSGWVSLGTDAISFRNHGPLAPRREWPTRRRRYIATHAHTEQQQNRPGEPCPCQRTAAQRDVRPIREPLRFFSSLLPHVPVLSFLCVPHLSGRQARGHEKSSSCVCGHHAAALCLKWFECVQPPPTAQAAFTE